MHLPEAAQVLMGRLRQGDEAVLVALGVTHMHAPTRGVDVAALSAASNWLSVIDSASSSAVCSCSLRSGV